MITIVTEDPITADGMPIRVGMKVWIDYGLAGVIWAYVVGFDSLDGIVLDFRTDMAGVSPKECFADEGAAIAKSSPPPSAMEVA